MLIFKKSIIFFIFNFQLNSCQTLPQLWLGHSPMSSSRHCLMLSLNSLTQSHHQDQVPTHRVQQVQSALRANHRHNSNSNSNSSNNSKTRGTTTTTTASSVMSDVNKRSMIWTAHPVLLILTVSQIYLEVEIRILELNLCSSWSWSTVWMKMTELTAAGSQGQVHPPAALTLSSLAHRTFRTCCQTLESRMWTGVWTTWCWSKSKRWIFVSVINVTYDSNYILYQLWG